MPQKSQIQCDLILHSEIQTQPKGEVTSDSEWTRTNRLSIVLHFIGHVTTAAPLATIFLKR